LDATGPDRLRVWRLESGATAAVRFEDVARLAILYGISLDELARRAFESER